MTVATALFEVQCMEYVKKTRFGNEINHYLLLEYNRTNGNSVTMQHSLLQAISMFLSPRKPFGDIVNANVKDNDLTHKKFRSYLKIIFRFLSHEIE